MLLFSLSGLAITVGALLIKRNPLLYAGTILGSGVVFVMVAGMMWRWFRKYGRRRSRHGNLARGQGAAMFAFCGWLLQLLMFVVHFSLAVARWKGF